MIAEIKKEERYKLDNVILCGPWYGSKPDMNLFLSFLVADLIELNTGLNLKLHDEDVLLRARLLGTIVDLPARASVYCMTNHKGKCGCSWCLNEGKSINRRYCFAIDREKPDVLRTAESVQSVYNKLKNTEEEAIDGFKDISVLSILPYWNVVYSDSLDAMHQMHGIFKTLTSLWSKPKFKTYAIHLKAFIWDKFCQDYAKQRNVSVFKRPFRSLKEHSSHFKAMEALQFLLYSYPLLQSVLRPVYFKHHMILINVLTRLFSGPLQWKELDKLENDLFQYVLQFQVRIDIYSC